MMDPAVVGKPRRQTAWTITGGEFGGYAAAGQTSPCGIRIDGDNIRLYALRSGASATRPTIAAICVGHAGATGPMAKLIRIESPDFNMGATVTVPCISLEGTVGEVMINGATVSGAGDILSDVNAASGSGPVWIGEYRTNDGPSRFVNVGDAVYETFSGGIVGQIPGSDGAKFVLKSQKKGGIVELIARETGGADRTIYIEADERRMNLSAYTLAMQPTVAPPSSAISGQMAMSDGSGEGVYRCNAAGNWVFVG